MIYCLSYPEEFTEDFIKEQDLDAEFLYLVPNPVKKIYVKDVTFDYDIFDEVKEIIVVGAEPLKKLFSQTGITKLSGHWEEFKDKKGKRTINVGCLIDPKITLMYPQESAKLSQHLNKLLFGNNEESLKEFHYPEHAFIPLKDIYNYLKGFNELVIDIETSSLNPYRGEILGIVISPNGIESYYYDWETLDKELLTKLLKNKEIIGHNIKFDWKYLIQKGIDLHDTKIHDTMVLAQLSGKEKELGLKPLSLKYTNLGFYDKDLQDEKKKICRIRKIKVGQFDYSMFPAEILGKYACYDGVATYQLWEKWKELTENPVYPKIMDAIKELGYMELNGAPIDEERLDATMIPLQKKIKELYGKLMHEVRKVRGEDAEINFNSPKQLAHLFFEEMGLTSIKQTDTGNPSTDKEVLNELANQGIIIAKLLLEYRTLNKFVNTYLTNIKENIDEDGRVRTSFNITGTTSGRLSSGKDANAGDFATGKTLNFQNIPSTDKTVKKLFVPDKKDYVVLNMDLKNAELWLVGVLANEPNILNAFANGEDIHSSAAVKMFNLTCTPNDVKKKFPDLRQKAKTINFAILYLAGPGRIAQELQIDYGEAKNLIKTWYQAFPKVAEWIRKNKMKIEQTGEATTYFGRYRYDPDVFSMNSAAAAHHVKSLVNMLIQSVASDINLFGYSSGIKEVREFDLRFEPFALVHDSIVGICHKDDVSLVVSILKRHIQNVLPCWVPIGVDVEMGPSWGEVK